MPGSRKAAKSIKQSRSIVISSESDESYVTLCVMRRGIRSFTIVQDDSLRGLSSVFSSVIEVLNPSRLNITSRASD